MPGNEHSGINKVVGDGVIWLRTSSNGGGGPGIKKKIKLDKRGGGGKGIVITRNRTG